MTKIRKNNIVILIFILASVLSLFVGFFLNEDLSTGGCRFDFKQTWRIMGDFSNNNFVEFSKYTSHVPVHYFLLFFINNFVNDIDNVRFIYLIFSFLLPIFFYLNLAKIYNCNKSILFLFSFSLLLFPFFRAMAIWPNAHLTASIFFLISNYFYLKGNSDNKIFYRYLNLLFLAFATYSMQSYVILFSFYLIKYFLNRPKKEVIQLFLFCILLSTPGLYMLSFNTRIISFNINYLATEEKNFLSTTARNFSYIIATTLSLILFYLLLLMNNNNLILLKNKITKLSKKEIFLILALLVFVVINFTPYDNPMVGGGFFYKLSNFLFNNNFIFFSSYLLGLILCTIIIKEDKNLIYAIAFIILMTSSYIIFQKYYEPLFILLVAVLHKNFLINNLLLNSRNIATFIIFLLLYLCVTMVNSLVDITNHLHGTFRIF